MSDKCQRCGESRVYVVMGSDESHGWIEAAFADKSRAEALAEELQDTRDSSLDFYDVKEVRVQ